jgi:hypothetical protein
VANFADSLGFQSSPEEMPAQFNGYSLRDSLPERWVVFSGLTGYPSKAHPEFKSGVYKPTMFSCFNRKDLSFTRVMHLYNPWNEGKPVKIGRDGQVLFS